MWRLRVKRKVLFALGAMLTVAVLFVWVQSYWRCDLFLMHTSTGYDGIAAVRGTAWVIPARGVEDMGLQYEEAAGPPGAITGVPPDYTNSHRLVGKLWHYSMNGLQTEVIDRWMRMERARRFAGFQYGAGAASKMPVGLPMWFVTVLPLGICATQVRRRRVLEHGTCEGCGYDLRASEGRCPECGRAFMSA
jgi:hypothetical protein